MNTALLLSGGKGSRIGSEVPKQYLLVGGKMIIIRSLETLCAHPDIDAVQIVAEEEWKDKVSAACTALAGGEKLKGISEPGRNRQESILNGLKDISEYADENDVVLVHDAARPFLTAQMVTDCLKAIEGHEGVMPVLPMKDTVYFSENGTKVDALLNRNCIFAGQAPEAFLFGRYLRANEALYPTWILKVNGSTEPAVMADMDVVTIPGDERNFKITTAEDLERYEELIREKEAGDSNIRSDRK